MRGEDSMAIFAPIYGAADVGWYWHLVERELRERGHETVAPDLPCDDDDASLGEYADTVAEAVDDGRDLVVVATSFGGYTATLVADRLPVDLLVLVQGMVPAPGEKGTTGSPTLTGNSRYKSRLSGTEARPAAPTRSSSSITPRRSRRAACYPRR